MKKLPWFKFEPSAWSGDDKLASCSLAAQGLWIRCLCIMHEGAPYGYLAHDGVPVTIEKLAKLSRISVKSCIRFVNELETNGVFSRDEIGIFSRRMVADHSKHESAVVRGSQAVKSPVVQARIAKKNEKEGTLEGTLEGTVEGTPKRLEVRGKRTTTTKTSAARADREKHWAQPLADAWDAKFGPGSFQWKRHVRALGALGTPPPEEAALLAAAFTRYLAETEPKYASLSAFLAKRRAYLAPTESEDDRECRYVAEHGGFIDPDTSWFTDAGDLVTNPNREAEKRRVMAAWH